MHMKIFGKIAGLLILVWLTWLACTTPWVPMVDNANLIFHEAGHVLFSLFGELLYFAGGSLFQILLPLLLIIPFLQKQDLFSATLMLWWTGENMIGVGRYIADARAQQLVLLGGEHDWAVILSRFPHIMQCDTLIGAIVRDVGITIMIGAIVLGILLVAREKKSTEKFLSP